MKLGEKNRDNAMIPIAMQSIATPKVLKVSIAVGDMIEEVNVG